MKTHLPRRKSKMIFFNSILPSAIAIATVFLFGCTGEIIMEKAGHLNLGVPGIMSCGTLGGCLGVVLLFNMNPNASWFLVVLMALLFSALLSMGAGLIYALLTVTLKCNQNVTGLALTTFGAGFTDFFMSILTKKQIENGTNFIKQGSNIIRNTLPFAETTGTFGKIFFNHGILVYLAIIIAIIVALVLKRTRIGLSLRAVGENPATADAAGINVTKYKYAAILSGSAVAGFGGLFYVLDYVKGSWENSATIQAFGWLSIALVIFCVWKPIVAITGAIVFGALFILSNYINVSTFQMKLISLIPYVVTIIVLIITSIVGKKSVQPPQALGQAYFREDR